MKLVYQCIVIFFNFSPTSKHFHSLQVENCNSNSRLVVDEDDNGKLRLERVKHPLLCALKCHEYILVSRSCGGASDGGTALNPTLRRMLCSPKVNKITKIEASAIEHSRMGCFSSSERNHIGLQNFVYFKTVFVCRWNNKTLTFCFVIRSLTIFLSRENPIAR